MSSSCDIVIETKDLKAGYGERVILENINLRVREGEIVAIIGRSGSGKSTLLKHLIGLYPPLGGEVRILGRDIATAQGDERQRILRQFGVLYQSGAMFGSMSVIENVRLPLEEFTDLPKLGRDLVAFSKLKLVGLARAADAMPSELSGGMLKRAALARAMALDPRILFLDEPSVGLDPITSSGLDDLIKELSAYFGITFLIITHELPSIFAIAHRAIMLDERTRTIVAEGSPAELRDHSANPLVTEFFRRRPEAGSTLSQGPAP